MTEQMIEQPPRFVVSLDGVKAVREAIAPYFAVTDTTPDWPKPGYVRFRGRFLQDADACFDAVRALFEAQGFTPMVREENGRLALIGTPGVYAASPTQWGINLVLFLATVASTMLAGALYNGAFDGVAAGATGFFDLYGGIFRAVLQDWTLILSGWPFSLSILLILGTHELGHYFAARYHKVPVTLPFFIPLPISIIGTMGAVIRLKAPVKNKRALLDVGAAGPLAGFIVAVPIFIFGLATSQLGALPDFPFQYEGNSLVYIAAKFAVFGRYLPADGVDVYLNQVAWAAWVGMLVTGLNLIPVGQLDGGHVAYVLFGQKARRAYWPVLIGLTLLVLLGNTYIWVFWILLLLAFGRVYAEPLDDVTPLDVKRKVIAVVTLLLFVLVFVPLPFQLITP
jgi:hypothetical protein